MKKRIYTNEQEDTKAIHSIGNGNILVYEQGPNVVNVLAPYTSPTHFTLRVEEDRGIWETGREPYTDFFNHENHVDSDNTTVMKDYCHQDFPCFIREIKNSTELSLTLHVPGFCETYRSELFEDKGFYCITYYNKGGNPIVFHTSHTPFTGFVLISMEHATLSEQRDNRWIITLSAGKSSILASGDADYGAVITGLREIAGSDLNFVREERKRFWMDYAGRRNINDEPDYVDSAIVCIKTQQSTQGGLPSCNGLPYGYSRDNYGASRAYLKLGYYEDARKVLDFRFNKWTTFGTLRNAEGMGCYEPRHFSENEEVEQTSYTLLSARDYYLATYDNTYIHSIFLMLMWCLQVQLPHIHKDMLPFNGDETYIAGGMLARSSVNHGSAESTMMFIEGAQWLTGWAIKNGRYREIFGIREVADKMEKTYHGNFVYKHRLMANNPLRIDDQLVCLPANRGVCAQGDYLAKHRFGAEHFYVGQLLYDGKGHFVRDIEIPKGGFRGEEEPAMEIGEVLVTPAYFHSKLFDKSEMLQFARDYIGMDRTNKVTAGHEPALLLYTLCKTGAAEEEIREAREWVLTYANENGSWDEYYVNDETKTVRHRPWETGYSLEALLLSEEFLKSLSK